MRSDLARGRAVLLVEDHLAAAQDLPLEAVVGVERRVRLDLPQGQALHLLLGPAHHLGHGLVGAHQPGVPVVDRHRYGELGEGEVPQGRGPVLVPRARVHRHGAGHEPEPAALRVQQRRPLQPYHDPVAVAVPQRHLPGPPPALGRVPPRGLRETGGEQVVDGPAHELGGFVAEQAASPVAPRHDRSAGVDDERQVLRYASLHGASGCAAPGCSRVPAPDCPATGLPGLVCRGAPR